MFFIKGLHMPVPSQPFVDATACRLRYHGEIATLQVQPQLFKGATDLYPRMSPSIYSVVAFFEGDMLYDISWMFQRKFHFVPLHGKDALQTAWHGFQGRIVGGVVGGSYVIDLIPCRHDGKTAVKEHR